MSVAGVGAAPVRVLAAPDKFRGTATAAEIAAAVADGATDADPGALAVRLPLADGGEGLLDVLPGDERVSTVTGPLGRPVAARWRLGADGTAVIEAAQACGLALAGGAAGNEPMSATTRGVGELVAAAVRAGARRVVVGVGGSASTDGGLGAVEVLADLPRLRPAGAAPQIEIVVACDVRTAFLDAADVFGPQKGADAGQVVRLRRRLAEVAQAYRRRYAVDVTALPRAGAAGGLAGGLAALGARLVDGFELVAAAVGLPAAVHAADLVVTGEGRYDATSLQGKVVGGVAAAARAAAVPCLVVAGDADPAAAPPPGATLVVLSDRFGRPAAFADPAGCVRRAVGAHLAALLAERATRAPGDPPSR